MYNLLRLLLHQLLWRDGAAVLIFDSTTKTLIRPTFGGLHSMQAKLIMVSIPAAHAATTENFYAKLFDTEFAPALSGGEEAYHAPMSVDGIDLQIGTRHKPEESVMAHFAVDDLNAAITAVTNLGGQLVAGPFPLTIDPAAQADYANMVQKHGAGKATGQAGTAAIVRDPDGGTIGLVQLEEHTHKHFAYGKYRTPLTPEQRQIHQEDIQVGKKHKKP